MRPLSNVRDEFFETFSSRAAYSEFSLKDFEASKESLQRMLDDFERDMGGKKGSREKGMALLLRHYEEELKRPIRNMFSGNLPRSALIQVSFSVHLLITVPTSVKLYSSNPVHRRTTRLWSS